MPTPIDILLDPVNLGVLALYTALLAWEHLAPARALPRVARWRLWGSSAFVAYVFVSSYLPILVADWFASVRLFDASALGTWGGGLLALCTYALIAYGYHRAMHASSALFQTVHQMHHSAERLDVASAFWFSPLDAAGFTLMSVLALSLVGVTPQATTLFVLSASLLAIFQHTNVRTPQWLGYFVQRPESHSHHHARGLHRGNYADLPVIDMIFGTFHNPPEFAPQTGYFDGGSSRVFEMLTFQNISEPAGGARVSAPG